MDSVSTLLGSGNGVTIGIAVVVVLAIVAAVKWLVRVGVKVIAVVVLLAGGGGAVTSTHSDVACAIVHTAGCESAASNSTSGSSGETGR